MITSKKIATYQEQDVFSYTLTNKNGYRVTVMNYGATVLEYSVPNRENKPQNIVLHYEKFEHYIQNNPKLGACIGPVAGRLEHGRFSLNGKVYQLEQNNLGNHLHGGKDGLSDTLFQVSEMSEQKITFYTERKDGTGGYPGNVCIWVSYELSQRGELHISYQAKTDKDTLFNPTNHTYFNINDMKEPIDNTSIQLKTNGYTILKNDNIPTGEIDNQATFLTAMKKGVLFKDLFKQEHAQLLERNGLDHAFVLEEADVSALLYCEKTGIHLQMKTDAPALVIYTANGYEDNEPLISGVKPFAHNGVALETQILPDAIHQENFGNIILKAGEVFSSSTVYYAYTK
ncbi:MULTISPECIES: aldose epimerase family protein [unclassified Granulicatella]|uniref:aldose epimerase family protein n=1 Tax=unclassified Granulicatella TaxID=2630493 RepID=UPI00107471F7|nr:MULTISPECIES: aldose epimerase family protein [unclassified Granulicatella]MBF0780585.1 galactose mutarotase [Granulicatella sp. 19428wC4_WM01]TFU94894.1 galactose mutarotase [Granulicatella sp. WM01]